MTPKLIIINEALKVKFKLTEHRVVDIKEAVLELQENGVRSVYLQRSDVRESSEVTFSYSGDVVVSQRAET